MVDVRGRLLVLPALIPVLFRREGSRFENGGQIHHATLTQQQRKGEITAVQPTNAATMAKTRGQRQRPRRPLSPLPPSLELRRTRGEGRVRGLARFKPTHVKAPPLGQALVGFGEALSAFSSQVFVTARWQGRHAIGIVIGPDRRFSWIDSPELLHESDHDLHAADEIVGLFVACFWPARQFFAQLKQGIAALLPFFRVSEFTRHGNICQLIFIGKGRLLPC